jgi:Flp pilus assembly protein TadG
VKRLCANERGAALVELALVSPVLILAIVGIVDISNAFSRKLALEQGAQRAIEKIMQTTADDTVENTLATEAVCQVNGMTGNTCNSTPITTSNVAVTWRRECTSGGVTTSTTYTTSTAFDATAAQCSTGASDAEYLQVRIDSSYTPMFPIHFASYNGSAYPISATAGMRTK